MNDRPNHQFEQSQSATRLKTPLDVWVLYSDDEFKVRIARELMACLGVNFEFHALDKLDVSVFRGNAFPDLIFVQTGEGWATQISQLQHADIDKSDHDMAMIVFGEDTDHASLRMALRLGASDYLSDHITHEELMPILAAFAESKVESNEFAELFLFINTKGGMGATTLCLNSAIEVAINSPGKVLYLDLDLHFGVATDYLNLNPSYSLTDAIEQSEDLDEISLQSLVTKHDSGLRLLSFNHETPLENYEQSKRIGSLIPILRRYYKYIFVDMSAGADCTFSSVMSQASKAFLITQQNLIALKNASSIIRSLRYEYGIQNDSMALVVNRFEKKQQIRLKDIEGSMLGIELFTIPNDFKVSIESTNLGKPFIVDKPHSMIGRSIHEFCKTLSPDVIESKGWLDRFFN
ncbi:AAA family ATPase [Vibrio sp.]|nr:AAA family ATPase [Vibrio sp.]